MNYGIGFNDYDYVSRAFSCGIAQQEFDAAFRRLGDTERTVLETVGWRAWVALKLRYHTRLAFHPQVDGNRGTFEIDQDLNAFEIYLLFTCIDAIVGSQHRDFKSWLSARNDFEHLDKAGLIKLYEDYLKAHGTGSTLRRAFRDLPIPVRDWLCENVHLTPVEEDWLQPTLDVQELLRALFHYFYELRRNLFTHKSLALPAVQAKDLGNLADDTWTFPANLGELRFKWRKGTSWRLSYRQGVDEALILHVVTHGLVLDMLGLKVTEQTIAANVQKWRRLHTFHHFFNEVERNRTSVRAWWRAEEGKSRSLAWTSAFRGVPTLSTIWTDRALAVVDGSMPMSGLILPSVSSYRAHVVELNGRIEEFNETHHPLDDRNWGPYMDERIESIASTLRSLADEKSGIAVVEFVHDGVHDHLWRMVREPCAWVGG